MPIIIISIILIATTIFEHLLFARFSAGHLMSMGPSDSRAGRILNIPILQRRKTEAQS